MRNPHLVEENFERRVRSIPALGLGLSVDVYQPNLFELMKRLEVHALRPGFLEVFKATNRVLAVVRQHFPDMPLTCHGEGLWITQPDFDATSFVYEDIAETVSLLDTLQSPWLNHECATKQMAGYSFGTYLPPLYTSDSARVVADNITLVQEALDRSGRLKQESAPLFLLEMPPLTYFMAGTISIPQFFRLVTAHVPCGLVLDIGHLWTVYRYTAARRMCSLEQFVETFLDEYPMERVIEIHVAGLIQHESIREQGDAETLPEWIDAHAAPIPAVSFTMLEQVLAHPRLVNLRGVALEVDTKPIDMIIDELGDVTRRFGAMVQARTVARTVEGFTPADSTQRRSEGVKEGDSSCPVDREQLQEGYARYAQIASGQRAPTGPEWQGVAEDPAGLARYATHYLPHEILHWGGELIEMYPDTCRALVHLGISLNDFVAWWFRTARPVDQPYDFFLLKIERFLGFVAERAPTLRAQAEREAELLQQAYAKANDGIQPVMESTR